MKNDEIFLHKNSLQRQEIKTFHRCEERPIIACNWNVKEREKFIISSSKKYTKIERKIVSNAKSDLTCLRSRILASIMNARLWRWIVSFSTWILDNIGFHSRNRTMWEKSPDVFLALFEQVGTLEHVISSFAIGKLSWYGNVESSSFSIQAFMLMFSTFEKSSVFKIVLILTCNWSHSAFTLIVFERGREGLDQGWEWII